MCSINISSPYSKRDTYLLKSHSKLFELQFNINLSYAQYYFHFFQILQIKPYFLISNPFEKTFVWYLVNNHNNIPHFIYSPDHQTNSDHRWSGVGAG